MAKETIEIQYDFEWEDKRKLNYLISIDKGSLKHQHPKPSAVPLPKWVGLEVEKCKGCPLAVSSHPQCPVAVSLFELTDFFKSEKSYSNVKVKVTTPERTVNSDIPLQKAVQSIFGALMATSGCPKLNFLAPMARFHLPFSTTEETIVRSLSFYLVSQLFLAKSGKTPDWNLKNFEKNYAELVNVNEGLSRRIHKANQEGQASGDAMPNAIAILDAFAQILSMEIEEGFPSIAYLFKPT